MKKNVLKTFLALITVFSVIFVGCASEGDDSPSAPKYDEPASGNLPQVSESTVIRNKVVNLNGSTDVYYEYLTFTSATGGTYSVYKDVNGTKTVVPSISLNGNDYVFPTEFTYDAAAGKFTAGTVSSYMFDTKKDGKDVCAVASEILTTDAENKSSLFNVWKSTTGVTFDFSEGTVAITVGDVISTPLFTNNNGWISIPEDIEMCWLKQGTNYNLYYPVFVTERETVEAAGKSLATDSIDLVSSKFLLVR